MRREVGAGGRVFAPPMTAWTTGRTRSCRRVDPPEDKRRDDVRPRSGGTPVFVDQTTEDVDTLERLVADTVATLSEG